MKFFPRESTGFRILGKVIGEVHFKQIFRLVKTCQNCTLEKIVIEGISYLIKQFGTCTCTPQLCMVERSGCSCCSNLPIERKAMQYRKAKTLAEGMESKLEQYCKGSKENINCVCVKRKNFCGYHSSFFFFFFSFLLLFLDRLAKVTFSACNQDRS